MLHLEYASLSQDDDSVFRWVTQFQKLSAELADWAQTIPTCLQLSNRVDRKQAATMLDLPSVVMLHAYYHALVIHIHSLLSDPTYEALLSQLFADTRKNSQDRCLESIRVLVEIATGWTDRNGDRLGWPSTWSIWIGARYVLVRKSRGEASHSENFSILLNSLRRMSRYWQVSGKYFRLLKQAATELRSGDLSNARNEQGILRFLIDFRVATSDLEDQFRVDPMLQYESTAETPIPMTHSSRFVPVPDIQDPQQSLPDDSLLNLPYKASDNWFNIPLFASSSYHHDYVMSSQTC
jgi:hypothetical protein